MPWKRALVRLLPVLLATLGPAAAAERLPGPVAARVLDVVDGDTLAVRAFIWLDQEIVTRVRLEGVDTPELRGRCAREKEMAEQAHTLMRSLATGNEIVLYDIQHDKYGGRVRARVVTRDGTDLADALIRAGLARRYSGDARRTWCSVAERP